MPFAKPGRKGASSRTVSGKFKVRFVNWHFVRAQRSTRSSQFALTIFLTGSLSVSCPIDKLWNDEKTGASSSVPATNNALSSQSNNYNTA